jgi:hypothetical protein
MTEDKLTLEGTLHLISGQLAIRTARDIHWLSSMLAAHFFPDYRPAVPDESHLRPYMNPELVVPPPGWPSDPLPANLEAGRFRITFEPLQYHRAGMLTLQGYCGIDDIYEFYVEGPEVSGFLVALFLKHFFPDDPPCGDPEDYDCEAQLGGFRVTFEAIS